jgi:uncharacterized integral membrane protein
MAMSSSTSRGLISLVSLLIFLLFSFVNVQYVDVNLIFFSIDMPQYVVAFGLFALGILAGFMLGLLAGDSQKDD